MAKEYIERKAVLDYIDHMPSELTYDGRRMIRRIRLTEYISDSIPAADVEPVRHGRWLSKEYMYGDPDVGIEDMWVERLAEQSDYYAYCSVCGKDTEYNAEGSLILSDYCPHCGAKMDGDGDG